MNIYIYIYIDGSNRYRLCTPPQAALRLPFGVWTVPNPQPRRLIIGAAQLLSLLLRGSLLGVSTCHKQFDDWAVYLMSSGQRKPPCYRPDAIAILFAGTVVAGAWLLTQKRPDLAPAQYFKTRGQAGLASAFAGAFTTSVGSGMAGRCAAGQGVGGMALRSSSSLVATTAAPSAAIGIPRFGV